MRKKRRPCPTLEASQVKLAGVGELDADGSGAWVPRGISERISGVASVKAVHSDESLMELFALIESNPCLWKNDSKHFKNLMLKRRLWGRFAAHLRERFPALGPFTPDNLRYVYNIKRRQYYDELKEKTIRKKSGSAEYTGRWKYFESLSFLRVHSEPYRTPILNPQLNFEDEQMLALEEDAAFQDGGDTGGNGNIETGEPLPPPEIQECLVTPKDEQASQDNSHESSPEWPPLKRARLDQPCPSSSNLQCFRRETEALRVENVYSHHYTGQVYDECDQFGNIIANHMRRLSDDERLEFHYHIIGCTKDFFKCMMRFNKGA